MEMGRIFLECMPQCPLTKQDQLRKRLLFDRSDPPLGEGIQIRRAWWQGHTGDARMVDNVVKSRAVLAVRIGKSKPF